MKQIIPFTKDVVFEDSIASVVSISLEHDFKIDNNEIVGEFLVIGEYKKNNDSTCLFDFEEHIPFNLLIPDGLDNDTIKIDVDDFTYELKNDNSIKVNIDLSLFGEEQVRDLEDIWGLTNEIKINEDNDNSLVNVTDNVVNETNNINIDNNIEINNSVEYNNVINEEVNEVGEYIIYHIHIVKEGDTVENIVNQYNTNIEILKEYNDVSNLNVGDKIIIPEIYYGTN